MVRVGLRVDVDLGWDMGMERGVGVHNGSGREGI